MNNWNIKRQLNARIFKNKLRNLEIVRIPMPGKSFHHAWYKFYCYINNSFLKNGWSREIIIREINNLGYPCFEGSCSEIYREKIFKQQKGINYQTLPVAHELGQTSLMFAVHPTISTEQMNAYVDVVYEVLSKANK